MNQPSRVWLIVSGVALAIAIMLGAAALSLHFRARTIENSAGELEATALVLAQDTDRMFQSLGLVQAGVTESLAALRIETTADFDALAGTQTVREMLVDRLRVLPHIDALALALVDASGRIRNVTRRAPFQGPDVSNSDYFRELREEPGSASLVARPVLNSETGRWTMYLARRVQAGDGSFLGLVLGAIDIDHVEAFYKEVAHVPGRAISLVRLDGVLLARHPSVGDRRGLPVASHALVSRLLGDRDRGTKTLTSAVDGLERLGSANRLPNFPLAVAVSDRLDSVLAPWRTEALYLAGFCLILDLLIGLAVWMGLHQLKHQSAIMATATWMARHDSLTGLPNRLLLRESMAEACASRGAPEGFALMCLDLDGFKAVNDTHGHPAGDRLLQTIGERLRGCLAPGDLVARLGGDEFAILQRAGDQPEAAERLATRLLSSVSAPAEIDGRRVGLGATIGFAVSPRDGTDPDELLRRADLALYRAKAAGGHDVFSFDLGMDLELQARRALESDLQDALERGELAVHYQPIHNVARGHIAGFEALLRWDHPARGLVGPAVFVPIAEARGLIEEIGAWTIRAACRDAARWSEPATVAVNLSALQFASGALPLIVAAALAESGLSPHRLELEITESVPLHDDDVVRRTLHDLRALGVRIALDDFGTGYSSLSYLLSFPFDRIKIDRSFVRDMDTLMCSATIVATIVDLARGLGMATTAEGVETRAQMDALMRAGCTDLQGYLFSKARPAGAVEEMLAGVRRLGAA